MSSSRTPRRVSSFDSRSMIAFSTACTCSSDGAGALTNAVASSEAHRYTPSSNKHGTWPVEVGGGAEALEQRDRAAVAFVSGKPGMRQQVAHEHTLHHLHHLQHRRVQLGLRGQHLAQQDQQRQHPSRHRQVRDAMVDQRGRSLRHAAILCNIACSASSVGAASSLAAQRGAYPLTTTPQRGPATTAEEG